MIRQILTIVEYTLLEALHARLIYILLGALAAAVAASVFIGQVAITETLRIQITFLAASSRIAAIVIVSLYIISSMIREFNDRGLELMLSLDLPRSVYVLGKFTGFVLISAIVAFIVCLPVAVLARSPAVIVWGISLAFEVAIISAFSLFCIVTFSQIVLAVSFVLAFYLLARSMTAIQLMSSSGPFVTDNLLHQLTASLLNGIALLLPKLDAFTQASWLVNSTPDWQSLGNLVLQSLAYSALLVSATVFDLYRKTL